MFTPRDILLGIVLPFVVAGIVLLIVTLPWRKVSPWRIALGWGLSVGVAFAAAFGTVVGTPGRPWVPEDWLLVAVMPAAIGVGALAWTKLPTPSVWLLRLLISAGVPLLLCQSYLRHVGAPFALWTAGQATAWVIAWTVVIFIVWTMLALRVRHGSGRSVPLAMAVVAACCGAVVLMSDSQSIGQLGLALGAAILAAVFASLPLPRHVAAAGAVDVAWVMTAGLLILGRHYAESNPTNLKWALLAAAPLLTWVAAMPAAAPHTADSQTGVGGRRWLRGLIAVAAVSITALAAVGVAFTKFHREMTESGFL